MRINVVIPCYNTALHIESVINSLPTYIGTVIAVNDASKDNTLEILERMAAANPKLVVVNHTVNQGVGGAMISGYIKSIELGGDVSIKMDGDGQMDPTSIQALVKPIEAGLADFTKGNRFRDFKALRSMPLVRRIGNLGLSFLIKAASGYWNIFDPANGYTAIRQETLEELPLEKLDKRYFFESSVLIQLYHQQAVIQDIPMKARYGDEISGLSVTRTLFEFPPKLFLAFFKRIMLRYFFFDFNIASIYILSGTPLFLIGVVNGMVNYFRFGASHTPAPTGTVVIPTLLIILGFQLLLSAINYDMLNYPKRGNSGNYF